MFTKCIQSILSLCLLLSPMLASADNGSLIVTIVNNTADTCALINPDKTKPSHGYVAASSAIPTSIAPGSSGEFTLMKGRFDRSSEIYLGYSCGCSIVSFSTSHPLMSKEVITKQIASNLRTITAVATVTTTDRSDSPARVTWVIRSVVPS